MLDFEEEALEKKYNHKLELLNKTSRNEGYYDTNKYHDERVKLQIEFCLELDKIQQKYRGLTR